MRPIILMSIIIAQMG